jgi:hypothetical protein
MSGRRGIRFGCWASVVCAVVRALTALGAPAPEPATRAAKPPTVRFVDATERLGLKGLGGGKAAWRDFDGDGWVDLYVPGQLWRNVRGERFARADKGRIQGAGVWGDYDNDGRADLFCWSGGPKLFRNTGRGGFADVSSRLPEAPMRDSRGATWGDFDGDGFLDLYVGGYERPSYQPDAIYRNDGKGRFALAWKTPGRPLPARGVTAADYDEDGDLDIYVSNYRLAPNLLLRNDGSAKFTDVAPQVGVAGDGGLGAWGHTIGSAWGDLDDDGHLDLFVGNFSHRPAYQDRPKFYRNLGPKPGWRFVDQSRRAGLARQESFASPALGDFDNDGDLDLLFTTVYGGDHCVLYRNDGGWTFTDVTRQVGLRGERTYQAAWADYDRDGDLDLVMAGRLFRNELARRRWLAVRLVGDGKAVSRDAVGAQVRIRLGKRVLTRQVEAATGEGNQNEPVLHFALPNRAAPVTLEIRWPGGATQALTATPDRLVVVPCRPTASATE